MKRKQRKHFLQRVRELTLAGTKQAHICRILNISDPTVRKYQKMQNLSPRKKHDTGEGLHYALGIVDRVFGNRPLPFDPTRDSGIAAALLEGFAQVLAQHCPDLYRQATEKNLDEFRSLLTEGLRVKRLCADTGTVH
jgi:hypothetical protein